MKEKKSKNMIEIKFNSEKEKIFIFLKGTPPTVVYEQLLNIFNTQVENKIYLLPKDYVDSVIVVKDVKKHRTKNRRRSRSRSD